MDSNALLPIENQTSAFDQLAIDILCRIKYIPSDLSTNFTIGDQNYTPNSIEEDRPPRRYYKKRSQCQSCDCVESPLWRTFYYNHKTALKLCNACGLKFSKGHYCIICFKKLSHKEMQSMIKSHLQCLECESFTHDHCMSNDLKCTRCGN